MSHVLLHVVILCQLLTFAADAAVVDVGVDVHCAMLAADYW